MINFKKGMPEKLLEKHRVTTKEVGECFANGEGLYFVDDSEEHRTDPPTYWFMAPTNHNRMLKICFVRQGSDGDIKTAFQPTNEKHLDLYRQLAKLPSCWPLEE